MFFFFKSDWFDFPYILGTFKTQNKSESPVLLIVVLVQTVPWPDSTRCRRAGEIVPEALSSIEEIPDKKSTHKQSMIISPRRNFYAEQFYNNIKPQ